MIICHVPLSCLSETERLKKRVILTAFLISPKILISTLEVKPVGRFEVSTKNSLNPLLPTNKCIYRYECNV